MWEKEYAAGVSEQWLTCIPSSSSFPSGREKWILSRRGPASPPFSRQSACPAHPAGACRVTLPLLVNVWSLFVTIKLCGGSEGVAPGEKAQPMVGAGLPVAEHLNTTFSSSRSTSVLTSEIPSWRISIDHYEGWSHSDTIENIQNYFRKSHLAMLLYFYYLLIIIISWHFPS